MHKFRYGGYTFGSNSSQAYIDAILAYNADAAVELLSINGNNVASSDPLRMQDSQKIRNSSELKEAISRLKQLSATEPRTGGLPASPGTNARRNCLGSRCGSDH